MCANKKLNRFLRFRQFLGNKISTQTAIGTAIAILGVALYSLIKAQIEEAKRVISCFVLVCPDKF
jgi:hypothetical protein